MKLLDGPFRRAMETDKAYLLRLEPDRLLAGFRREAGLPKKADPYGGWETIPDEGPLLARRAGPRPLPERPLADGQRHRRRGVPAAGRVHRR